MRQEDLKVLIVDDESDIRERLSSILKRRGYSVLTAENGLEGLHRVIENRIDIIICDIYMPNMNGVEFLRKIRQINIKAEVIIVTGCPSFEVCVEFLDKNIVDYLTKPLTVEDILNSLDKAKKRIHEKDAMPQTAANPAHHFSIPR